MDSFATRTGLAPDAAPRRYLWTDAFAVCNYLALHARTGAPHWLDCARRLVDQVHRVLGRHRPDDARTGWISGLDDQTGARHPTAGGLRIGKRLPERGAMQPADAGTDWDRDGQYHHYLTRWMHALRRAAAETGDGELLRHGVELAKATHAAFAHRDGGDSRLYWKMSIDLSRPIVTSMGQHDALDGLVAAAALDEDAARLAGHVSQPRVPSLDGEISELAAMCRRRGWTSGDTLGIGGLLADAWFLSQLSHRIPGADDLLARVLHDAARSLELLAAGGYVGVTRGTGCPSGSWD